MQQIFLILDVVFAIALIGLILIQQGKGATMGAGFGGGASQTVFGSQGAGSFMVKITATFAVLFFLTSLYLGHLVGQTQLQSQKASIVNKVSQMSKDEKQAQAAAQSAASRLSSSSESKPVKK